MIIIPPHYMKQKHKVVESKNPNKRNKKKSKSDKTKHPHKVEIMLKQ